MRRAPDVRFRIDHRRVARQESARRAAAERRGDDRGRQQRLARARHSEGRRADARLRPPAGVRLHANGRRVPRELRGAEQRSRCGSTTSPATGEIARRRRVRRGATSISGIRFDTARTARRRSAKRCGSRSPTRAPAPRRPPRAPDARSTASQDRRHAAHGRRLPRPMMTMASRAAGGARPVEPGLIEIRARGHAHRIDEMTALRSPETTSSSPP